jgi:hypothetical protein
MNKAWWQHHLPAEVSVDCSGQEHRVCWEDGELVLLDHNDPEGEMTLAALAGEACECVEILRSWGRHTDDLRVLLLASRGSSDPINIHLRQRAFNQAALNQARPVQAVISGNSPRNRSRRIARASGSRVLQAPLAGGVSRMSLPMRAMSDAREDDVVKLLRLGGGLSDRLVATVIAEWSERVSRDDERVAVERAALTVALYGRVTSALRAWLDEPELEITLDMIEPSEPAELTRRSDGVHARMPFRWLIDIWARGVSVVLGRFATQLLDQEDERQRVLTVSPDLFDIRPVTIGID